MISDILILIIAFIALINGANKFIDGSSNIASYFKISKLLIGLTIVAFGTCAPELAVSIQSILNNSGELVLGNVIGSNIINILLILGICSQIRNLKVKDNTVKKEIPILLLITFIITLLFYDTIINKSLINSISKSDGLIILLFFGIFVYYLISVMKNKIDNKVTENISLTKAIIFTILGLITIIISSNFVVDSAINIAKYLGISERMISLTIIAIGTSLPELATSIASVKKNEQDILIGNIIGSNILNLCIVLGLPVAFFGGFTIETFQHIDFIILVLSSVMIYLFARKGHVINKLEGKIMLMTFLLYYLYIIFF